MTDVTHVLLVIVLVLLSLVGIGLVVLLWLAISTLLEVFALAKAVRKEVATAAVALRAVGEGIGGRIGKLAGFLDFIKPQAAKKPARKATRKKA